jgi:hypothetical protein
VAAAYAQVRLQFRQRYASIGLTHALLLHTPSGISIKAVLLNFRAEWLYWHCECIVRLAAVWYQ